jgi:hypothetical protein
MKGKVRKNTVATKNQGDSLIRTTTINSGGWEDEPYRSPTIHDIRRKIGRIPSDARHS